MVRERVCFRYDFHLYVIRYFDGYEELWAESLYEGGHHNCFLGKMKDGVLVKPKNFRMLKWSMQTIGMPKLLESYRRPEKEPKKAPRRKKKETKPVYTREDFIDWGKKGSDKRWIKKRRVIHSSSLQEREGGIYF